MIHTTLNTGHSMTVPRDKVGKAAIKALSNMVAKKGDVVPGFSPWRTVITRGDGAAIFDIRRGKNEMIVCNVVAWTREGAENAWDLLERHYMDVGDTLSKVGLDLDLPEMPESLPWLATWILPQAVDLIQSRDMMWVSDFEQCLAATILHRWAR